MYLTVGSLIDINNIKTDSINITLRKVNVKPNGYDKIYVDKILIEDKSCQIIDQFNERKISSRDFYLVLLENALQFYDGNKGLKSIFINFFINFEFTLYLKIKITKFIWNLHKWV